MLKFKFFQIRSLLMLGCVVLLQACSTTQQPEAPVNKVSKANSPSVQTAPSNVACQLTSLVEPVWALDELPANADNVAFVKALVRELEQRKEYERQMKQVLQACIKS